MPRRVEIASLVVGHRLELLLRVAYNQVMLTTLNWLAPHHMTRIPVLLRVIKDDDCSTTNLMSIDGDRTTYSTKPSFHQYSS
jgi:hypothetical protein